MASGSPALRAIPEEAEGRYSSLDSILAGNESSLDPNNVSGKRKTRCSDAARSTPACTVRHQPILWICFFKEIVQSEALECLELLVRIRALSLSQRKPRNS